MGRFALYGALTSALTAFVVGNAWVQRRQFYPTCIHLTRSSASLMVLLNMGLFLTIMFGHGVQRVFFGNLRALEVEHLYERSWFAVTETCLAMTIFRDEFDIRFIIFFAILLLIKIFHWISQDRVDFYTILMSLIFSTSIKYILHTIDMRMENPWENKSMYIFYLELVVDFFKLITYFLFFAIVVRFYGLPLHIVRDLYMTLRSFINRCKDLVQYRRATANMNERYPDATVEELAATDRICIICREEMEARVPAAAAAAPNAAPANARPIGVGVANGNAPPRASNDPSVPKKLQCGHIFHFRCLRSWLERQQSCPTCRRSVLADTPAPARADAPPPQPPQNPIRPDALQAFQALWNQQQQQAGAMANNPVAQPFGIPPAAAPVGQPAGPTATTLPPEQFPLTAAGMGGLPMSMFTLTPLIPLSGQGDGGTATLDHLSDDQLRSLEGRSREAVIQRIRAVQNVQLQLTGITTQLTQILQMFPQEGPAEANAGEGTTKGKEKAPA
ncbi:E3 ubiquitin-protein ligase hrd1 [Irineochytrium annulatum]|nr:E3 ubiquitin-protein ligase hrd1 [Irineochytrium annulatum]